LQKAIRNGDACRPLLRNVLGWWSSVWDNSVKAARDPALLLIGFALRRTELIGLNVADVKHVK
jgi:hypothetical protein